MKKILHLFSFGIIFSGISFLYLIFLAVFIAPIIILFNIKWGMSLENKKCRD